MASAETVAGYVIGRNPGERDHRLGNVIGRILGDTLSKQLERLPIGRWSDQHSVAAGFSHGFHYQLSKVTEDVVQIARFGADICFDGSQDGVFAEVITNEFGNISVDRFIVCDSIANRVCQGNVAGPVSAHQSWYAKQGVTTEGQRIQKFIIHAAVDDVDPLQASNGLHEYDAAVNDQITALNQFDAHLACQEAVLEIGAVVNARGKQHHLGIIGPARGDAAKDSRKLSGIVIDGQYLGGVKPVRGNPRH